ncbi:hypothetical protein B0H17DRAFT_419885 [Mycena rosella]|uniref:Uncharacterized protein n=1 Tax=Mycena rosella TaxID=1033263 RepID=A0AAD7G170_MYCRO|nr:hypothetical protein B0H17DRAFT_419885 [Mycena rosella]
MGARVLHLRAPGGVDDAEERGRRREQDEPAGQGRALSAGRDAAPDCSRADIWVMGVPLPGWGDADDARPARQARRGRSGGRATRGGGACYGRGRACWQRRCSTLVTLDGPVRLRDSLCGVLRSSSPLASPFFCILRYAIIFRFPYWESSPAPTCTPCSSVRACAAYSSPEVDHGMRGRCCPRLWDAQTSALFLWAVALIFLGLHWAVKETRGGCRGGTCGDAGVRPRRAAGKDVGMWFGPSAVAAAMRTLVDAFPACGLGVSVATDGTLYQLKSSPPRTRPRPARPSTPRTPTHPARPLPARRPHARRGRPRGTPRTARGTGSPRRRCGVTALCCCYWAFGWGWAASIRSTTRRLTKRSPAS